MTTAVYLAVLQVTANHFLLDAVFGAAALWVASKLAPFFPRVGRGADEVRGIHGGRETY